ncbi:MAG TPA: SPOR domain-containing protein [Bryobacteraceae bacterium]|nr:SPOR domain-containing protein [Bryobacteraceae bacterium]
MKKNEDGEVELILGNGQLLGVFFIVVILLALFFGMGYVMGRNSGSASVEVATAPKQEVKPLVVESPVPKNPGKADEPATGAPEATSSTAVDETSKSETPAAAGARADRPSAEPAASSAPKGVYLQLAATTRHEAELEVEVLRRKDFHATSMEVPEKPGLFRVLVGPIADGGLSQARADLQDAGFPGKSAIVKRF